MNRMILCVIFFSCLLISITRAQFATIGGGALLSERPAQAVAELNGQTAPFFESRAYITLSWTDESASPTIISAIERSVIDYGKASTGFGAGLLWLEFNDYEPRPMLVSSTVVSFPLPRTSLVLIGSTLPFDDFEWSLVLKVGWAFWFKK